MRPGNFHRKARHRRLHAAEHLAGPQFLGEQRQKAILEIADRAELVVSKCRVVGVHAVTCEFGFDGIVVNEQGVERALATPGVQTLGYPYSISAYFRRTNANMTRAESRSLVETLRKRTKAESRGLVVYISMAFGNPYDEPWGPEIVEDTLIWLKDTGVRSVSLADTVGTATPEQVGSLYRLAKDYVAGIEMGVHLHSRREGAAEKVLAAYEAGCRRFDGALTGLGGCPFAGDDLVGNIPTEIVVETLEARGIPTGIPLDALGSLLEMTNKLRREYAYAENAVQ